MQALKPATLVLLCARESRQRKGLTRSFLSAGANARRQKVVSSDLFETIGFKDPFKGQSLDWPFFLFESLQAKVILPCNVFTMPVPRAVVLDVL